MTRKLTNKYKSLIINRGFTLIELLVVISIIGILMALSIFGLQGAREASRDSKRKSDIELIRSGIEIYKSDCNVYPTSLGSTLVGDDTNPSCDSDNTYISEVPLDPIYPTSEYYYSSDGVTYQICASLEQDPANPATCTGSCGGNTCNYKVVNP